MRQTIAFLLSVFCLACGIGAKANPYWVTASSAYQVPGTTYVKFAALLGEDMEGGDVPAPVSAANGDRSFAIADSSYSFGADTGSGSAWVQAIQFCDCAPSPGLNTYTFLYGNNVDTWDMVDNATVIVHFPPEETAAEVPLGLDEGVDCALWCTTPAVDEPAGESDGLSTTADATTDVDGTTGATGTPHGDVSGIVGTSERSCSAGLGTADPVGSALLLAGLLSLMMGLRRRSR